MLTSFITLVTKSHNWLSKNGLTFISISLNRTLKENPLREPLKGNPIHRVRRNPNPWHQGTLNMKALASSVQPEGFQGLGIRV